MAETSASHHEEEQLGKLYDAKAAIGLQFWFVPILFSLACVGTGWVGLLKVYRAGKGGVLCSGIIRWMLPVFGSNTVRWCNVSRQDQTVCIPL